MRLLVDLDVEARLEESKRGGEAADAASGDENAPGIHIANLMFQRLQPGLRALRILVASSAGDANAADDPAVDDDRQAALHRHRAFKAEEISELIAFREQVLEHL